MKPLIQNTLAVLAGLVVGSLVNMCIIMASSFVIPPPDGADLSTIEGLKSSMHLFLPKHFVMPFLAHALGTFSGALITALIAVTHKIKLVLVIGVFFLIGGSLNAYILPAPLWFILLDLIVAYIPMSYLGGRLGNYFQSARAH